MTAPVMRWLVARCRVVVDNDFAGDRDGLVWLAELRGHERLRGSDDDRSTT